VTEIDPYELAREEDERQADVEPDDESTKVLDLIPEGLDRAGSTRNPDDPARPITPRLPGKLGEGAE
jgi:hypothetical protein